MFFYPPLLILHPFIVSPSPSLSSYPSSFPPTIPILLPPACPSLSLLRVLFPPRVFLSSCPSATLVYFSCPPFLSPCVPSCRPSLHHSPLLLFSTCPPRFLFPPRCPLPLLSCPTPRILLTPSLVSSYPLLSCPATPYPSYTANPLPSCPPPLVSCYPPPLDRVFFMPPPAPLHFLSSVFCILNVLNHTLILP